MRGQKRTGAEKDDLWIFVYDRGQTRFIDMRRAFVDAGKKLAYATFDRYRRDLLKEGKIEIFLNTGKKKVYRVPPKRRKEVKALKEKRGDFFLNNIESVPPAERLELLKETQRDLRIRNLEMLPLPFLAAIKHIAKMQNELGWSVNFNKLSKVGVAGSPEVFDGKGEPIAVYAARSADFDRMLVRDIELKVVSEHDYFSKYLNGTPWKKLCEGDVKGEKIVIVGAYKELLRLSEAKLRDESVRLAGEWREKFKFAEDDWKIVSANVLEMIRFNTSEEEIEFILSNYFLSTRGSKTPQDERRAEAELSKILERIHGKEQGEEITRKVVANYNRRRREKIDRSCSIRRNGNC